ncbi:hypothetical protein F5887DRAFT_1081863 [Amanita rubescens]|nr:hypothetical protein F5887DRAFT_1081863 [Amanita rubescens]
MQQPNNQYTPSNLSAASGFITKDTIYSYQWEAAVRAIIRHRKSADKTESSTRVPGGLHPMYFGLQERTPDANDKKELVEKLLTFEKLTVLDRIDGGISVLLHCPGYLVTADTNADDIPIEIYATGREAKILGTQEPLVRLIRAFGNQIALPHLHRFIDRYGLEGNPGITPSGPSKPLRIIGPPYLPSFSKSRNGYLRIRYRPSSPHTHTGTPKITTTGTAFSSADSFAQWTLDTAISGAPQTISSANNSRTPWTSNNGATQSISALSTRRPFNAGINRDILSSGALICIGNETGRAMDRLRLPDEIIPRLRALICETRSSRWEDVLCEPQWGLDRKAANILAQAMHVDTTGKKAKRTLGSQYKALGAFYLFAYTLMSMLISALTLLLAMRTWFLKTAAQPSQANSKAKRRPRAKIGKGAQALAVARRQTAADGYNKSIDSAWSKIDEEMKNIATKHHKSLQKVQTDLHMGHQRLLKKHSVINPWNAILWKLRQEEKENGLPDDSSTGKQVLQDLIKRAQVKYGKMSKDEINKVVDEYTKAKVTKAKGCHASARSMINDVISTMGTVENELEKLNSRSGVEAMVFVTRSTTGLPLRSRSYNTPGIAGFMETTMKIDQTDFLGKMEGFSLQGLKGAAKNHQQRVSELRSQIRQSINVKLQEITGNPAARMEWKFYFRNVVQRYSVKIDGWPVHLVRFQNLSEVSSAYDSLKTLLDNWSTGKTCWRELSEEELEELVRERQQQADNGEIQEPVQRRPRSDRGKKRKERQAEEDEDDSSSGSPVEDDQPRRRKRVKRAAVQKTQAGMGRKSARKALSVSRDGSAEANDDNDDNYDV